MSTCVWVCVPYLRRCFNLLPLPRLWLSSFKKKQTEGELEAERATVEGEWEHGSLAEEKHMVGASCLNVSLRQIHFLRHEGNGVCRVEFGLGVCLELSLQIQQLVVTNRNETQPFVAPTEPQSSAASPRRHFHSLPGVFTMILQHLLSQAINSPLS